MSIFLVSYKIIEKKFEIIIFIICFIFSNSLNSFQTKICIKSIRKILKYLFSNSKNFKFPKENLFCFKPCIYNFII